MNRLSRNTQQLQSGDFTARIAVRRRDQVGDLQRSFNGMAENLQRLVRDAAQKEIWEHELSLAYELQHSLLPGPMMLTPWTKMTVLIWRLEKLWA